MDKLKICEICNKEKNLEEFSKHMYSKDGYYNKCKQCVRERVTEPPPNPLVKTCNICKVSKSSEHYRPKKNGKWGLAAQCKECISKRNKEKSLVEKTVDKNSKTCCQCNIEYPIEFYTKDSYKSDGLRPECNNCKIKNRALRKDRELETGRIYRENNRELVNERARRYRKNNPEKVKKASKKSHKKWKENNKEKYKEGAKKSYEKNKKKYFKAVYEKKKRDPLFKLSCSIRTLLSSTFKRACEGKFKKSKRSKQIIKCDVAGLFNYIESQFTDWMTWENYGKCNDNTPNCSWELDHIIPSSYAKTEEEIYLLNHWSNFQPMCSKLNTSKSNKVYPCTNLELRITFWEDCYEYV